MTVTMLVTFSKGRPRFPSSSQPLTQIAALEHNCSNGGSCQDIIKSSILKVQVN